MKILLVTPMPPRPQAPGAIPLVLYAELTGLMAKHELSLATVAGLEPGEDVAIAELEKLQIPVHVAWRKKLPGLQNWRRRWRMAGAWLSGRFSWRTIWFWEPGLQTILDELLAKNRYDLVIVEDNAMGIYTFRTPVPTLFTEHEVRRPRPIDWKALRFRNIRGWTFGELDWMRWRSYQEMTWKKFDRIQTFSGRDADAIRSLVPEVAARVRVNPFGIALPQAVDLSGQDDRTILFVGNFTHPPNVDAALWLDETIMPLLRDLHPGVSLLLIGIYPPKKVLEIAGEDIHVLGPVEEIDPYLEQAAVVVAPLRIGGGMRMKVLHSLAIGKAVVTTSRGADGLAVAGVKPPLVTADNAKDFACAVAGLLSDRQRRIDLGVQARKFAETYYSAQAYARRIEAIYEDMKRER